MKGMTRSVLLYDYLVELIYFYTNKTKKTFYIRLREEVISMTMCLMFDLINNLTNLGNPNKIVLTFINSSVQKLMKRVSIIRKCSLYTILKEFNLITFVFLSFCNPRNFQFL